MKKGINRQTGRNEKKENGEGARGLIKAQI